MIIFSELILDSFKKISKLVIKIIDNVVVSHSIYNCRIKTQEISERNKQQNSTCINKRIIFEHEEKQIASGIEEPTCEHR